jgi:hypothetical protein
MFKQFLFISLTLPKLSNYINIVLNYEIKFLRRSFYASPPQYRQIHKNYLKRVGSPNFAQEDIAHILKIR